MLSIGDSKLLFSQVAAQTTVDSDLRVEVKLVGVGARPFSLQLQLRSLKLIVLVLDHLLSVPELILLRGALNPEVFEALVELAVSRFDLRNTVVLVLNLLSQGSDLSVGVLEAFVTMLDHISLVVELTAEVFLARVGVFKSAVLQAN